jgi:DHA1 family multidrug resistance protein-like MFS transporter
MQSWKRNFALVWLNNFVTAVGMMAVLPLLPLYLPELGVTDPAAMRIWSGVLVAGAPLTAACMGPLWGALGDRVGRKPMMLRANLAVVIFVGAMSLVTSPVQLLVLRLVQGVFSGFMAPSMTIVSVMTPPEKQGGVTGMLHTAVIAGSMCGAVLGGSIADSMGFRTVFIVCSALSLIAAVLVALWVVEPPRERPAPEGEIEPLTLLGRVWSDASTFLAPGPLRSVLVAVFAVRFGSAMVDPMMALHVKTLSGYRPELLATTTGVVFASTAAATLLLTPLWGRAGDRRGYGRLLALCAGGGAVMYLAQGLVQSVAPLYVLRFLSGAFLAGIFPAAYAIAANNSPVERRGGALGFTFSSFIFANAAGPVTGGLLAATIGLRPVFYVSAALMAFSCVRVLLRTRSDERGARAASASPEAAAEIGAESGG